jgi:isocitrate dehydrogenase kinase/phosphatase
VYCAFLSFHAQFRAVTRRARDRFLSRDWVGANADAGERLGLYGRVLDSLVEEVGHLMSYRLQERPLWAACKAVYSSLITDCQESPHELVRILKALMPRKRLGELYTAIGYHKHGKTEFYRDFLYHLQLSADRFEAAEGARGMVMTVFTLPSYDVVFKVIKDRFDYPKDSSRLEVMSKYRLVFEHDRAGRLVEAYEFEHLRIEQSRFRPELLEELLRDAADSVSIEDGHVVIRHAYMERRVRPLNLYLSENSEAAARAAAQDYCQAIRDLAATNIFPGDLLLKNFGVTRHGRVVFYD